MYGELSTNDPKWFTLTKSRPLTIILQPRIAWYCNSELMTNQTKPVLIISSGTFSAGSEVTCTMTVGLDEGIFIGLFTTIWEINF